MAQITTGKNYFIYKANRLTTCNVRRLIGQLSLRAILSSYTRAMFFRTLRDAIYALRSECASNDKNNPFAFATGSLLRVGNLKSMLFFFAMTKREGELF